MPQAFDTIRTGKKYYLRNHGEDFEFEVIEILSDDFKLKDLHTLEMYYLNDLIKYGKGKDFEFEEISD